MWSHVFWDFDGYICSLVIWFLAYSINLHVWLWSLFMLPTNPIMHEKKQRGFLLAKTQNSSKQGCSNATTHHNVVVFVYWVLASTNFSSYCKVHPSSQFFCCIPNCSIHVGFGWVSCNARLPHGNILKPIISQLIIKHYAISSWKVGWTKGSDLGLMRTLRCNSPIFE